MIEAPPSSRPLEIAFATCGTRGDLAPVIDLAYHLRSSGHRVVVCGPPELAELVRGPGLSFCHSALSMQELLALPGAVVGARQWWAPWRKRRAVLGVIEFLQQNLALQLAALNEVGASADVILGSTLVFAGSSVAQRLGKPFLRFHFSPNALPAAGYPPPGAVLPAPSAEQRAALWDEYSARFDAVLLPALDDYRARHGLPRASSLARLADAEHTLLACDAPLVRPGTQSSDEGVANATWTGYWHSVRSAGAEAEARWARAQGRAALFVTLGSMPRAAGCELLASALEAGRRLQRPLLLGGQLALEAPEFGRQLRGADRRWWQAQVLPVAEAPHERLFPCCWAVVHHGGAGTVARAARAGVPQVILPQARGSDQRFWAWRVQALGIGAGTQSEGQQARAELGALLERLEPEAPAARARAEALARELERSDRQRPPLELARRAIEGCAVSSAGAGPLLGAVG